MKHTIILRAIVGSQAYGTSTPQSDIDYKGIYAQPTKDLISFGYKEQIEISKDETLYEIRRFLQLTQSANPTVLELLFSPNDCIVEKHHAYEILIRERHKFLTKQCANSFGGYAIAQIKKATALDKKMNWEAARVSRKTVLDFCYVYENGKSIPLTKYLQREGMKQEFCGLVALEHMRDSYAIYYDYSMQ
jgi:predicted nucleotidyltransferase